MELNKLIDTILIKSSNLVNQRDTLNEENIKLKARISELESLVLSKDLKISELIDKQKIQHMAGVFGRNEKSASIRKIDEVVREIDRCMALLNE